MPGERAGRSDGRKIVVVSYDESKTDIYEFDRIDDAIDRVGSRKVTWIIISGHLEWEDLMVLQERMGLHPVMTEELNQETPGRPKLIDYHDLILVSWKLLQLRGLSVEEARVTSLLGKGFLLTIAPARYNYDKTVDKLHGERNQLSTMGADFLLYELIDTTIDSYFKMSEELGDLVEETQDRILGEEGRKAVLDVQRLRRAIIRLRKAIWPLREAVNSLVKGQSDLVDEYTSPYYRDVYDHTIELMDTVDTHRDMLSEMLDLYQSEVSNQLNRVVKVLTIISVIFAPLTFIVGVYGMNFHYMPELAYRYSYPIALLSMFLIAISMLAWFRRKRWF